jgi:hypothetical protein
MKASTERKIIRWIHIIASIPIIGYIYGPVKNFPHAVAAIQWGLFPIIVLSGLWLWKGHWVRKWGRKRNKSSYDDRSIESVLSDSSLRSE